MAKGTRLHTPVSNDDLNDQSLADFTIDVDKAFGITFGTRQNLNVFCPFCEHKDSSASPSCSVSKAGTFTCKSCHRTGTAQAFYAQTHNTTTAVAHKHLTTATPTSGTKVPCKACRGSGVAEITEYLDDDGRRADGQLNHDCKVCSGKGYITKQRRTDTPVQPISEQLVQRCHSRLMRSTYELGFLHKRGLTDDTLKQYRLGVDEQRITIPVRDEHGNLIQLRRYLANRVNKHNPKIVCHLGGSGGPHWYPYPPGTAAVLLNRANQPIRRASDADRSDTSEQPLHLLLTEGECDTLLARQDGFDAYTITSGVTTWSEEFTGHLVAAARPIAIIYDVNDKDADLGQRVAAERARHLSSAGLEVKVVRLPLPDSYIGGDYTDWRIKEKQPASTVRDLIANTPSLLPEVGVAIVYPFQNAPVPVPAMPAALPKTPGSSGSDPEVAESPEVGVVSVVPGDPLSVTLYEAAHAKYFYRSIHLHCLVAGRRKAPYMIPHKIQVDITDEEGAVKTVEHTFSPLDGGILNLIQCSTVAQKRFIKSVLGIAASSHAAITVLDSLNIEELYIIPAVDNEHDQGPYTMRTCYFVGHGIETNRVYNFEGYTLPDPRTQEATHILTNATVSGTDLDQFELSKEDYTALRETFQADDVHAKTEAIASELAAHITHIYGRSDLHTAVDLVFHSPLAFVFDGTPIRKGWLEALIIGDTRTGKGFVAEGLVRHYGVGEVVSGETLTFAGLVGGIQKAGDTFTLVWGKIPLADSRLVVLDEAGSIPHSIIGRLSRIRSEGIAEITMILTEKTKARTRLLWLANPRPSSEGRPRKIGTYNYGIEAAMELIGAAEDIARFDFILTVAQNEVNSKLINKHRTKPDMLTYTADLCRKLIVWIWSRRPDQIVFEQATIDYIYNAAQTLGSFFSPSICLVQSEDVRFKLARLAAATAARVFSTPDGHRLLVKVEHVEFAYNFLHHIYSKASCGYSQLSIAEKEGSTLRNPAAINDILSQAGAGAANPHQAVADLVGGLLEHKVITARDICDYSDLDVVQARMIISELVRARALTKEASGYIKKPAFKAFLHNLRMKLVDDVHVTSELEPEETQ